MAKPARKPTAADRAAGRRAADWLRKLLAAPAAAVTSKPKTADAVKKVKS